MLEIHRYADLSEEEDMSEGNADGLQRASLLVIGDDERITGSLVGMLGELGASPGAVRTEQAFDALDRNATDAVLLIISRPEDLETLALLRERYTAIGMVAVFADAPLEVAIASIPVGGDACLATPTDPETLAKQVGDALEHVREVRQVRRRLAERLRKMADLLEAPIDPGGEEWAVWKGEAAPAMAELLLLYRPPRREWEVEEEVGSPGSS